MAFSLRNRRSVKTCLTPGMSPAEVTLSAETWPPREGQRRSVLGLPLCPLCLPGVLLAELGLWVAGHRSPGHSAGLGTDAHCPFCVHSHQRTFVLEVMGRHCG